MNQISEEVLECENKYMDDWSFVVFVSQSDPTVDLATFLNASAAGTAVLTYQFEVS